jgi:hypothetical protein
LIYECLRNFVGWNKIPQNSYLDLVHSVFAGGEGEMRKIVLVSAVVLALMLVTLVPLPARSEVAPEVRSLPFNALPVKEEFAEAVDLDAVAGECCGSNAFLG